VVPELAAEELYGMSQPASNAWPLTTDRSEHTRRSIYMLSRRTYRMPMLEVFDQPEGVLSCSRRESSTTSTQSLSLLNSKFTVDQAMALAEKATVNEIWLKILQREPDANELKMSDEFMQQAPGKKKQELVRALLNTNEFLFVE
jgi:hypothetical protein